MKQKAMKAYERAVKRYGGNKSCTFRCIASLAVKMQDILL